MNHLKNNSGLTLIEILVAALIVAGGMISFGDVQTLFTQLMSYFRVITNPTAVYSTGEKIVDGKITDDEVKSRLNEMVDKTLDLAKRN